MLDDLPEVARDWPQMSDAERASWSLDWDQVIGGDVRLLERQRRSDQMTPDQQARYRDLLCKLKEALPIIERLGLYRPPVQLED